MLYAIFACLDKKVIYVFNPLVTRVANIVPYGTMTYFLSKQCSFNITDSILH